MRKRALILAVFASLIGFASIFKGYYASEADWKRYESRLRFYETIDDGKLGAPVFLSHRFLQAPNELTEKEKMIAWVALPSAGILFIIGFLAGPAPTRKQNSPEQATENNDLK